MTKTRFTDFEVAVGAGAELGEGPRWDAPTGTLLWVDISGADRPPVRSGDQQGRRAARSRRRQSALPRRRGGVVIGLPMACTCWTATIRL